MAFDYTYFQRWSVGVAVGANNFWGYTSAVDDLATITTAGYFNSSTSEIIGPIALNDLFYIVGSDAANFAQVTAITPNIVLAEFSAAIGVGAVNTANLAAGAVTAAKIAAGTITATQIASDTIGDAEIIPGGMNFSRSTIHLHVPVRIHQIMRDQDRGVRPLAFQLNHVAEPTADLKVQTLAR